MTTKQRHALEIAIYGRTVPRKRGYQTVSFFDTIGRLRFRLVKA